MNRYNPLEIEAKWQKIWEDQKTYKATDFGEQPKCSVAAMFPYPSGAGLHVGHVRNYSIMDAVARFKRQQGYNVMHPIGFDTFGLPTENYAIKTGISPAEATRINCDNFRNQMKKLGFSVDWDREVITSDPEYYRWTQWCFLELYKKGLAYQAESYQWWCPIDQTVLANEQVENGHCWRCGSVVEKKKMKQWFFKITAYADELLDDIDALDWPEKIKTMQKNWIGRSEGAEIVFESGDHKVKVFTTRPDTLSGATFLVLAPEHPLVPKLVDDLTREKVDQYREETLKKSEITRQENKEKTGIFTGSYAINPLTKEQIPIWIADYVLMGYGEGAIMAVPAEDERDHEFADKFKLPIIEIDQTADYQKHIAKTRVEYRMRDWLISRQRYWGAPIPIAYDKNGNAHPIPEDQLPVLLPELADYAPDDSGHSALAKSEDFLKVTIDGEEMTRETDTMDGYACSSWYLWRYADPRNNTAAWDKELVDYWNPLDFYGGGDHAVAHLLYIRFWTKFFADQGYLSFREPVKKLLYNGYILAPGGLKMSKSKGNVIDPLDVVNQGYGADTLRTYELFIGPYELDAAWDTKAIGGVYRFLNRCYTLSRGEFAPEDQNISIRHKTIKRVTEDLERQSFNTAVAALMEYVNELYKTPPIKEDIVTLARLMSPFAPHLGSEILERLGATDEWPTYDAKYLIEDEITLIVQINGKLRAKIVAPSTILADETAMRTLALADENIQKYTAASEIIKTIVVAKNKLVNIVIK